MRLAVDTTNILGWGAVKDTYNLLGDGIVLVMRAMAAAKQATVEEWAVGGKLEQHVRGTSLKGEADLEWEDAEARKRLLAKIVADAASFLKKVRLPWSAFVARFKALRDYIQVNAEEFEGKPIYLLRNRSRARGLGFFEAGNFYPDFILWVVDRAVNVNRREV